MSTVHFGRTSNPLKLVFLHATGFNGYAYKSVLEPLGVHAVAIDMRGHGMTELPTDIRGLRNWHVFRDDVVAFLDAHVKQPVVLVGHSCGGTVAALTAAARPDKISGLIALDPVTMPLLGRIWSNLPGGRTYMSRRFALARKAGKRRAVFDSHQAAFDRYVGRGTFKGVTDEALSDYLAGGLRPVEAGMRLACEPLWEQAVFTAQGHNIFKAAKAYPGPKHFIYAGKFGPSMPYTRRKMGKIIGGENMEFHENFAHFFPLQQPEFTINTMDAMVKRVALNR